MGGEGAGERVIYVKVCHRLESPGADAKIELGIKWV